MDDDHTVWDQASEVQPRSEQVRPAEAPDHLAPGSCRYSGDEGAWRRSIHSRALSTGYLMNRSHRQAAARQPAVDFRDAKWQHRPVMATAGLNTLDLGP